MADSTNPVRPKVKAAAAGGASTTVGAALLAFILRKAGVDVDDIEPEVLVLVGGGLASALATLAAYVKRDGLTGAWRRVVRGEAANAPTA